MKTILFSTLTLLTIQVFAQLPTEDLRAYYPFSGNTEDEFGFNDGIGLDITLTEDRFGGQDCAYEFAGTMTSLILVQGMPAFDISPDSSCTISLWFNGGSDDGDDWESLFIKYGDVLKDPILFPSYGLFLFALNIPVMAGDNVSLWMSDFNVNPFPSDEQWHHIVGVFKAGDWSLYFDNVLSGSWTDVGAVVSQNASDVAIGTNFEGKIDDIAFYGRDLTVQEIDQLFNMPSSCSATSISVEGEDSFTLYPNPASSSVTMDVSVVSFIQILDAQGKLVAEFGNTIGKIDLNVSDWEAGIYWVQIQSEKGNQSRTLVVD